MFKQILALVISGAFSATALSAAIQSPKGTEQISHTLTPQQQKMKSCNFEAKTKKISGDKRKQFMGECLSGEKVSSTHRELTSQQNKMKDCNRRAGEQQISGDVRRNFMSNCLKSSNH